MLNVAATVATTQVVNVGPGFQNFTYAGTVTGIRIVVSANYSATTAGVFAWALVHSRDGQAPNALSISGTLYVPEQNVLLHDTAILGTASSNQMAYHVTLSTKTMRKMKIGDTMHFLVIFPGVAGVNEGEVQGSVQYFYKS
jgi:hypothetical protein